MNSCVNSVTMFFLMYWLTCRVVFFRIRCRMYITSLLLFSPESHKFASEQKGTQQHIIFFCGRESRGWSMGSHKRPSSGGIHLQGPNDAPTRSFSKTRTRGRFDTEFGMSYAGPSGIGAGGRNEGINQMFPFVELCFWRGRRAPSQPVPGVLAKDTFPLVTIHT